MFWCCLNNDCWVYNEVDRHVFLTFFILQNKIVYAFIGFAENSKIFLTMFFIYVIFIMQLFLSIFLIKYWGTQVNRVHSGINLYHHDRGLGYGV
jgi:hypothetical protein